MNKHIEANAELAADLLRHMANNEIDSDYFAVVTDSPNCGREVQSEHKVTDAALMAAGIIDALLAKLEAAEKERDEFRSAFQQNEQVKQALFVQEDLLITANLNISRRAEAAEARLLVPVKLPKRIQWSYDGCVPKSEVYAFNSGIDSCEITIRAAGFLVEGDK
ncbi:Uncharacterised protein [Yersinia frederiksenii]|nr:Uncharacterised protein [Yersinia frederiksenii]